MPQPQNKAAMQALQQKYEKSLPARLEKVNKLWSSLCQVNWSDKTLNQLYQHVHQLAGNAKAFGYESLGNRAIELELMLMSLIESKLPPSIHDKESITRKIKALSESSTDKKENESANDELTPEAVKKEIFIVDDDPVSLTYFDLMLQELGHSTRPFERLNDLYEALETKTPDLVITDLVLTEGKLAGIEAIANIRRICGSPVPIIVVSARSDFVAKLRAIREGANGFLVKPVDSVEILQGAINGALAESDLGAHKVLIIDDDEFLTEKIRHLLETKNYSVNIILDPAQIFQALDTEIPDVILMDYHMPHCNGLEVAQMLRQDNRYMGIPIVFLTAERSHSIHDQILSLTGNTYLIKPVDEELLVKSISETILKSKRVRESINSVSRYKLGTNLLSHHYFFQKLETIIASYHDEAHPRYLAYISLDKPEYIRERLGWSGQSTLSEQINSNVAALVTHESYVTQLTDNTCLLLTEPLNVGEAETFFSNLVKKISQHQFHIASIDINITVSLGFCEISASTPDIDTAMSLAEQGAIEAAKKGGNASHTNQPALDSSPKSTGYQEGVQNAVKQKSYRLVYQPIVNLETNEKFFESLVRLQVESGKVLLPAQFMNQISNQNLQFELDRWVFENAITSISNTSKQTQEDMTIFIKLSPTDRDLSRYIPFISNVLRNTRLRGNQKVYLEVNEDWALKNQDRISRNIEDLRHLGCGFVIQKVGQSDFSIDLLRKIPADFFRIDGHLIEKLSTDNQIKQRIETIVEIANSRKIEIIAGTIEDASTFALLWEMGIRYFQGYFIQQPEESFNFDPPGI